MTSAARHPRYKKRFKWKWGEFGRVCALVFYVLLVIAPIYWMFVTSAKTYGEITDVSQVTYWPKLFTWDNYSHLFDTVEFGKYMKNSLLYALVTALAVVVITMLSGYGMSRYQFRGKGFMMGMWMVAQMIPGVLCTIPMYVIYSRLGLINTRTGLFFMFITGQIPFCTITMRAFFDRIPVSLEEAAFVDGCNRVQAIFKIVLPVLLPGMAAVFVFAFTAVWNDLMTCVIYTSKSSLWTINVTLKSMIGRVNVEWGLLMAGGIIALLPTIVVFAFVQRYVVDGLTAGAVKE